jgi:hypothetical protein
MPFWTTHRSSVRDGDRTPTGSAPCAPAGSAKFSLQKSRTVSRFVIVIDCFSAPYSLEISNHASGFFDTIIQQQLVQKFLITFSVILEKWSMNIYPYTIPGFAFISKTDDTYALVAVERPFLDTMSIELQRQ